LKRLGNVSGKKAKRKARESVWPLSCPPAITDIEYRRELETSRRVASLQKRREMKAAGLNSKLKTTKKGEMDYNADIPFERIAAPGFFDTQDEESLNEKERQAFDPKKIQLGNKRKGEDVQGESKRQKPSPGGQQSISAAAMKAAQAQKLREAERNSIRVPLSLPAPQVGEADVEDIVKMGKHGQRAIEDVTQDGGATRGLLGDYSMTSATPIRTPRAAPEEDRIANELRNIRAFTDTQSALLGGENNEIITGSGSTGFEGIAPTKQQIATPHPMATPFRQSGQQGNAVSATPLRTPRDSLLLNRGSSIDNRQSLLNKLAALPKAKALEFELELPEEQEEVELSQLSEEDAAVRDAREKQARDARELAEFSRQTQVVQKRLPRPAVIDIDVMLKKAKAIPDEYRRAAAIETALLIANDALKFGGTRVSGSSRPVQKFEDEALQAARWEVALESSTDLLRKGKAEFDTAFAKLHGSGSLPGLDGYYEDEIDEHQMMVEIFDNTEDRITEQATRSNELEKKMDKLHKGYQMRAKTLRQKIVEAAEALEKTNISLNTGLNAQVAEDYAISSRLENMREEVAFVSRREREAQEQYRAVKDELDGFGVNGVNGSH
jgi:pre-mRNA-splicing factor CDC5/CEF1